MPRQRTVENFATGFGIGLKAGKERREYNKEEALSEAYNLIPQGQEAQYDTITDPQGQAVSAIPTPGPQVQKARAGMGGIPTQQQEMLQDQAGTLDVPQKITLEDHVVKRQKARDIMRSAGVSGKEMQQFDTDYNASLERNARRFRDLAANAWQTGNYDAAAKYIESSYQYINDGSDVKAKFIPSGKTTTDGRPEMVLAMGFVDNVTGDATLAQPMTVPTVNEFVSMSEKAIDFTKGLELDKSMQALKLSEQAGKQAEEKHKFWSDNKKDNLELDQLTKVAGLEKLNSEMLLAQNKYNRSFAGGDKEAKSALAYEKEVHAVVKDRIEQGDTRFNTDNPDTIQDLSRNAAAFGRMTNGELPTDQVVGASIYVTPLVARINEQVEADFAARGKAAGTDAEQVSDTELRRQKLQAKQELMTKHGILRKNPETGEVEIRVSADGQYLPAPPSLYGGTPLATQYRLKETMLNSVSSTSGISQDIIDRARKVLGLPPGSGGGGVSVTTSTTTSGPAGTPAQTAIPTPGQAPTTAPEAAVPTSRVKPEAVKLPPPPPKEYKNYAGIEGKKRLLESKAKTEQERATRNELIDSTLAKIDAGEKVSKKEIKDALDAFSNWNFSDERRGKLRAHLRNTGNK